MTYENTQGEMEFEDMLARTADPAADRARASLEGALAKGDPERLGVTPGRTRSQKAKASRQLGHNLANKTVGLYQGLGLMAWRADYTMTTHSGAMKSIDLLGFGDVMAVGHTRKIIAQSTTADQRSDHERKLVEDRDEKKVIRILKTPYALALEWLDKGGEIHMVLWAKDDRGRWKSEVFEVTREWLVARHDALKTKRDKRAA